jgi:hypothetical protein
MVTALNNGFIFTWFHTDRTLLIIDHALDHVVYLFLLLLILLVSFLFYFLAFSNLLLKNLLSFPLLFKFFGLSLTLDLLLNLFVAQHNTVHLCIVFLQKRLLKQLLTSSIYRRYCCSVIWATRSLFK